MKKTTLLWAMILIALPILNAQVIYNPAMAGLNKYTSLGLEFININESTYNVHYLGFASNIQLDKLNTSFQLSAKRSNSFEPHFFGIGAVPELQIIEDVFIRTGINYNIKSNEFWGNTFNNHSFSIGAFIYNNSSFFAGASVNDLYRFEQVNGKTIESGYDRSFLNLEGGVLLGDNTNGGLIFSPMVSYQHYSKSSNFTVSAKTAYRNFNLGARYTNVDYKMRGIGANFGIQVNRFKLGTDFQYTQFSGYPVILRQVGVHLNVLLKESGKQSEFNRKYHRLYF